MKKLFMLASMAGLFTVVNAQIGINTSTPQASLDITSKNSTGSSTGIDGLLLPRLDRQRAQSMTSVPISTLIYINNTSTGSQTGTAVNIDMVGYYYYSGTAWVKLNPVNNIYNIDGTLTGNRVVTQGLNTLAFTGSSANAFSVAGSVFSVDAANSRVGIGTTTPQKVLHVNAASDNIRFQNLATLPTTSIAPTLVIDATGNVYQNNTISVAGQIIRLGINGATYNTGESALRFDQNDSASDMGDAPNGAPNFINTIVGATFSSDVSATAGAGSPARTTDRITLQPGVYNLQARIIGNFAAANVNNNVSIKCIVNNNEYSFMQFTNQGTQYGSYFFDDYINITGTAAQTIDFTIIPAINNLSILSKATPGVGQSFRSLIMIQRLR